MPDSVTNLVQFAALSCCRLYPAASLYSHFYAHARFYASTRHEFRAAKNANPQLVRLTTWVGHISLFSDESRARRSQNNGLMWRSLRTDISTGIVDTSASIFDRASFS